MKIRTDFVTNSSSSSFVCIRIQSEKLKELFEKYNFTSFMSDYEHNIIIMSEDIGSSDVDSIRGVLNVLIEDLEMCCKDDLIKEINNNYEDIINNIEHAEYKYSSGGWDEFEDEEDDEVYYVYEKEPNQNNAMIEGDNINFFSQEEMINAINEGEEDGVCLCAVDFGFYRPDFEESESSITTEAMINIRKLDDGNIRVLLMYLDAESEDLQRIQTCVSKYAESQEDDHDSSVLCVAIYPIKFSGSAWVAGYNPITFEIVRQDMSAAGFPIEAGVVVMEFMCHDDLNSVPNFLFNVVPDGEEEAITLLSKTNKSNSTKKEKTNSSKKSAKTNVNNINSTSNILGEKVVVNNDFSIVVPDGFRCSFNKSKNKLSCDCGGTPYLFYIYKGKCNKDPDDIYDDVLYQYDFVFAFENRLEDERIAPDNGNTRLSVDGNELEVFDIPIRDEYTAKYCVRYEDESSIIYGFSIRFYGVLYSGSVRFGKMSNESDCRKQFESILRSIQPLTKNQNQNNVVEKKTSNKNQINYKDCDFEEVDVMASRKKMLTSLDNRRNEDKPKGCDIRLVSLKEIFKDNEDLAISADIAFNFTMGEDDKQRRKELLQKAQEFAKVFRASPEEFDPEYDRESEIRNGYIKHIYGWAALKSLVYTGNRYALKNKTTLFDLSIEELVALSDFIESRGGANFKIKGNGRDTWMTAIRNQFEKNCFFGDWKIARFLHHFDKRFWDDKQVPLQNIIENLYDLIPVMEKIKNYVAEDKSRLNSAIAEILIAWCTFSIACREQFYIAKGVASYSLQQVGDDFIEMPKTADLVNHEENGVVTYKNYAVAYVGESKNVIIPEGIEYFIADRFEDVNELTLPSSLKVVNSDNGFNQFCRYIKKIIFSEGTESLNEYVFLDFSFLREPEEIVLPKSLKVIDSSLLSNTLYKVRYDSYALEYCKKNNLKYEIVYTPEELKEKENNELYSNALREYNQSTIASLNKAIELFDKLNNFKDSSEMSRKAQDKIDLIKKQEEERRLEQEKRLEEERRLAEARRLEEERILAERKAAKQSLVTERNSLSVVIEQNKHALFGEKAKLKKEAKARILEIDIELAKYSDLD